MLALYLTHNENFVLDEGTRFERIGFFYALTKASRIAAPISWKV